MLLQLQQFVLTYPWNKVIPLLNRMGFKRSIWGMGKDIKSGIFRHGAFSLTPIMLSVFLTTDSHQPGLHVGVVFPARVPILFSPSFLSLFSAVLRTSSVLGHVFFGSLEPENCRILVDLSGLFCNIMPLFDDFFEMRIFSRFVVF